MAGVILRGLAHTALMAELRSADLTRIGRRVSRLIVGAAVCAGMLAPLAAQGVSPEESKLWAAGNYSFSDELGGFTIRGISGTGTRENPIAIDEELYSASPVTMVIRANGGTTPDQQAGDLATSAIHLKLNIRNASGQAWIEFEFELQEILNHASIFSDGLSFDQRRDNTDLIRSNAFAEFRRDFEPYDRMRFINGKVDPAETASFAFALTDFTPRWTFYLVQDPRIPSS